MGACHDYLIKCVPLIIKARGHWGSESRKIYYIENQYELLQNRKIINIKLIKSIGIEDIVHNKH